MLQLGAVFGGAFSAAGIAALGPDLASDSDSLVDRLVRKDLIRPSTGDTLAFRHMLIEVAYQAFFGRNGRACMRRLRAGSRHVRPGVKTRLPS